VTGFSPDVCAFEDPPVNAMLARLLRPRDLGAYLTIYSRVVLGSIVGRLGMERAAVRFVSVALGN
jgi:O-antigen/teichoic acid export membrane protein